MRSIAKHPTFFFDVCIGKRIPEAVQQLRPPEEIRFHLGEGFVSDTPDDEWLTAVGKNKWVVVSQDVRFHKSTAAIEAIMQYKIGCFYVGGANSPTWDTAKLLISNWDKIREKVDNEAPPYIFRLNRNGSIHQKFPYK